MDRLRRSLDQVDVPICPNCRVEMKWYRSALVVDQPTMIDHVFNCPICQRIDSVRSTIRHDPTPPPGKLSAPRLRWRNAA
jgi:hypothetical protein